MQVAVWDSYAPRKDQSGLMHFDILVPSDLHDAGQIKSFGKEYLKSKPFAMQDLDLKKCDFCHVENAPEHIAKEVDLHGYVIIELSNCN